VSNKLTLTLKERQLFMQSSTNQLDPSFLSVCGLSTFFGTDSAPRVQMFSSHIGQRLVIAGATERRCQTGMEAEFGKYTFKVVMPETGRIIKVIDKYKETQEQDSIRHNPNTIVLYENENTREIGLVNLKRYCNDYHAYMGFEYTIGKDFNKLTVGSSIPKGAVFLDSPAITKEGGFKYGVELNAAFMSQPGASEDGVIISEDVLPLLAFKVYETRVVEWGEDSFPLNLYGTKEKYKIFPDIGEQVRADGIVAGTRRKDIYLGGVEESAKALMTPDFIFDSLIYANGPGSIVKSGGGTVVSGKVVDIKIMHEVNANSPTPIGMAEQPDRYNKARLTFYEEILSEYNRLKAKRGTSLAITPELHSLIVEAMATTDNSTSQRIHKKLHRVPLDDYRVEIVIEYTVLPNIGFKITGIHGDKLCISII
jgi:hypothetical protein